MTTATEDLKAGDLSGARAKLVSAVKAAPADPNVRFELAETLIVCEEWERADGHFDLVSTQDPTWGTVTALMRQLIRAEVARRDVFERGRSPEVVAEPTPAIEATLKILLESRQGEGAAELRAAADLATAPLAGDHDGAAFKGVRDLDDRTADVLEVLTSTGKYVWAPWTQVRSLRLEPINRLRDLVWRPAELDLAGGPSGVVYLPMIYVADAARMTDTLRLGRVTDWVEVSGLTCGLGQRCILLGDEVVSLAEVGELTFVDPGQASAT